MKKWLKILLAVSTALLLAGTTFVLNKSYINRHTQFTKVVIATEKVTPYKKITKYDLVKKVESSVPEDALTEVNFLEKEDWYAGELGIGSGDIIRKSRLVNTTNNPFGPALGIKTDHVLVGVKTDHVLSAGKNLKPGIMAHALVFLPGQDRMMPDRVIGPLEDAALANLLVKEVQNGDTTTPKESGREAIPVVAVIEASVPVAKRLVEYQERGKVYLAPTGVDIQEVLKLRPLEKQTNPPTP